MTIPKTKPRTLGQRCAVIGANEMRGSLAMQVELHNGNNTAPTISAQSAG